MSNSIVEKIERGRRAIALAKEQGKDTSEWERRVEELEQEYLLGWASVLADADVTLDLPVQFAEAPLHTVTTANVSSYARRFLKTTGYARLQQQSGGWGTWTPDWWKAREQDTLAGIKAMFDAMNRDDLSQNDLEDES